MLSKVTFVAGGAQQSVTHETNAAVVNLEPLCAMHPLPDLLVLLDELKQPVAERWVTSCDLDRTFDAAWTSFVDQVVCAPGDGGTIGVDHSEDCTTISVVRG